MYGHKLVCLMDFHLNSVMYHTEYSQQFFLLKHYSPSVAYKRQNKLMMILL